MTYEEFEKRYQYDPQQDFLARGGFGSVYKAYDTVRKRYVAIKEADVDYSHKFSLQREVELSHEIEPHPNIVRYINSHRLTIGRKSTDYAVMPYFEYGNLNQVLARYTLTNADRLAITEGLLQGVSHLHRQGIIHRDLKASNILMDQRDGQWVPKLTDFGISKLADTEASVSNTQIGLSIHYAAPEQLRNESILPNVDLWAVGVSLYKVVMGVLPFDPSPTKPNHPTRRRELDTAAIAMLINQGLSPEQTARIPLPFRVIIEKCLVVDRHERVKTADELLELLATYDEVEPVGAPLEVIAAANDMDAPTLLRPQKTPVVPEPSADEIAHMMLTLRRLTVGAANLTATLNLAGVTRFPLTVSGVFGTGTGDEYGRSQSQSVTENGEVILEMPYPPDQPVGKVQFRLNWPSSPGASGAATERVLQETDWYDWQRPQIPATIPPMPLTARERQKDNTGPTLRTMINQSLPQYINTKTGLIGAGLLIAAIGYFATNDQDEPPAKALVATRSVSPSQKETGGGALPAGRYQNGIAEITTADGRKQYKNIQGQVFDQIGDAHCGLVPVRTGTRWGYVNLNGDVVIGIQYDDAQSFDADDCTAQVTAAGKVYRIDEHGEAAN